MIKWLLVAVDLIIVLNVGIWVGINLTWTGVTAFNFVCLLLTLLVPAFFILASTRKSIDHSLNELLIPSLLVCGLFFLVNTVASSILLAVNKDNWMASVMTESITVSIFLIFLLITISFAHHGRSINK